MTPELRQHVSAEASELRARINDASVDPVAIASEAARLFEDASDDVRRRWLTLEMGGYGDLIEVRPLHQLLGVPPGSRLTGHITAYRRQRGIDHTTGQPGAEFQHFFIEPLAELEATRRQVATSGGTSALLLDFGPQLSDPQYPRAGEFSRDVFDRIVLGFLAALHLQLGELVR